MKRLLITIAAIIISVCTYAQMVPDQFTETVVLTDQDGNTHDINAYLRNGKYVFLDFFFTTCHYCQDEMPDVVELYRQMGCNEGDVIFIGIAILTSDAPNTIEWYMNEFNVDYPIAPLETNPINSTLADNWEIDGTPTYVFISPDNSMRELNRPLSSGELVGYGAHESACPDNWPVADFNAERTLIPAGESINFHNLSTRSNSWSWTFTGGTPVNSTDENPQNIVYNTPGEYNVTLTASNRQGNENTKTRTNYIKVIEPSTEPPTAYFAANQVTVIAGNSINFTDLSQGSPYIWQWWFEGAQPTSSNEQHPHNIRYNNVGQFNVTLIVTNTLGADTLMLENYINVIPSIGNATPHANFTCPNRLVQVNTPVRFEDLSDGYPMFWSWEFEGGTPATSEFQVLPEGVIYENSGVYDVTLSVSNPNGADILTKHEYIVVYENYVGSYCDTLCNLFEDETAIKLGVHGLDGYLGGHNSDNITTYADKFEYYTFNEISSITVPIMQLEYSNPNAYITFITWDGNDAVPTTVLSEQKVYLRTLSENYYQKIVFDEPLKVDGPFFLGFSMNYSSNENVVIGLSHNRGYGRPSTLYVQKDGEWQKVSDAYDGISASTGIRVASCLVGVEDIEFSENVSIYPNPCRNELNIENAYGFEGNDFIEIFDNLGRLVYSNEKLSGNTVNINITNIPTGTYITRIFTQGKVSVQKFEKLN